MAFTNVLTLRSIVARSRAPITVVESMEVFDASDAGGVSAATAIANMENTTAIAATTRRIGSAARLRSPELCACSAMSPSAGRVPGGLWMPRKLTSSPNSDAPAQDCDDRAADGGVPAVVAAGTRIHARSRKKLRTVQNCMLGNLPRRRWALGRYTRSHSAAPAHSRERNEVRGSHSWC